jgi:hypothetical protein
MASTPTRSAATTEIDLESLKLSLRRPRTLFSYVMSLLTGAATLAALFPLFSVLYMLVVRGTAALSLGTFRELPPAAMTPGGGFGNAIVGTFVIVAIATLVSVPLGILAAIYITEFGPDTKTASAVRFAAKVLTGLPSILAGVFAFAVVVVVTGEFSAPAGGRNADASGDKSDRADRGTRDADGRDARGGARRRRDGAAAVHRAVQQFLDEPDRACFPAQDHGRSDEADRVARGHDL